MATQTETKRVPDVACEIDTSALTLTFTFSDGLKPLTFDPLSMPQALRDYAMLHGLKQRIGDAAAIPRDPTTGRSATVADKRAAMQAVVDTLLSGEWSARREGGGNEGGLLLQALTRLYPQRDNLREWVAGKSKAEQAALRANPKIAAVIAEIRAAQAKGVDSDAILGELNGAE